MTSIDELISQREALEQQITELRTKERADAIAQAAEIINAHGLTAEDLFGKKKSATPKAPVLVKYRNKETGDAWTGRGRTPKWLDGKNKEDFAV